MSRDSFPGDPRQADESFDRAQTTRLECRQAQFPQEREALTEPRSRRRWIGIPDPRAKIVGAHIRSGAARSCFANPRCRQCRTLEHFA